MSFITDVVDAIKSKIESKPMAPARKTLPKEPDQFEFMEHYTFVDPRKVMINYDLFSDCEKTPVTCETQNATSGFQEAKEIPTEIALGFINMLKKTPAKKIEPKALRTISIIHTQKGRNIVVIPDLEFKSPFLILDTSVKPNENGTWFLDTTPEINRALVEAIKIHTR